MKHSSTNWGRHGEGGWHEERVPTEYGRRHRVLDRFTETRTGGERTGPPTSEVPDLGPRIYPG